MERKCKYRELEYNRPDIKMISKTLDGIADKVKNAKSYLEVKTLYETYDEIVSKVRTQAVLVQLRFWCDITNEFYQKEYVEFTSIADSIILPPNLCREFLNSKFIGELTDEYGITLERRFQESLSTNKGQELLMEDQILQNEYQMIVQNLKYSVDGREITLTELSNMKKSADCMVREKAQKAIYEAYLEKKEDFGRIFNSLIKVRNKRARLNGFKNYIDLGNCIWGRHDYGEDEIKEATIKILKYFRPLYDEVMEIQKSDSSLNSIRVCDRIYNFNNGKFSYENLLEACQKMFSLMGKQTGDYFDKLIEQDAFDVEYSEVKLPGIAFQNYINDINIAPIFGNFKNDSRDVSNIVHEFGHSFQEYQSSLNHKSLFNILPSIDISEIVSRSMEFYAYKYVNLFYDKDNSKWIYLHAIGVVDYILRFCAENEFENYLYENEDVALEDITQEYMKINRKYLPYEYDGFEDLIYRGADYFMFDSFITFPKYLIGYVPAYINAIELVFHTKNSYEKYLDICKHLGYRTYEETLKAGGLKHAFSEEAISLASNTIRDIIRSEHKKSTDSSIQAILC
ncbi:M3 family metallopeptidase [Clostridium ihumii]|uniref:M3 family metallopeptidase n=1 Tax=Clostridium ihumii TaxID=1470356 RepID=UPI003D32B61C